MLPSVHADLARRIKQLHADLEALRDQIERSHGAGPAWTLATRGWLALQTLRIALTNLAIPDLGLAAAEDMFGRPRRPDDGGQEGA